MGRQWHTNFPPLLSYIYTKIFAPPKLIGIRIAPVARARAAVIMKTCERVAHLLRARVVARRVAVIFSPHSLFCSVLYFFFQAFRDFFKKLYFLIFRNVCRFCIDPIKKRTESG